MRKDYPQNWVLACACAWGFSLSSVIMRIHAHWVECERKREREREKYYTDVWWCMQKKWYIHSGNRCMQRIYDIFWECYSSYRMVSLVALFKYQTYYPQITCETHCCGLGSKLWTSRRTWTSASRSPAAKHTAQYCEGRVRKMFIGMWPRPVTSWIFMVTWTGTWFLYILIALSSQPKFKMVYWNRLEHIWCTVKSSTHGSISKKPSTCCCVGQALSEEDLPPVKWFIRGLAKRLADLCHLITTEVPINREVLGNIPWIFDSPVVYGWLWKHVCHYPIHFPSIFPFIVCS